MQTVLTTIVLLRAVAQRTSNIKYRTNILRALEVKSSFTADDMELKVEDDKVLISED